MAAQTGVAERLRGRVGPEVVAAVERLAADAAAQGLPLEPLIQKAIEGGAKGVPGPRVIVALEELAGRLVVAARAARAAGLATPDASTIEAGAFALGTGLGEPEVASLVRASRPPHAPDVTLRVVGALAALGVPAALSAELVVQVIEGGGPAADVIALPADVQRGMGRGLTPAEAAGAARGGRGNAGKPRPGNPPKGPPSGKPPHPSPLPQGRP